MILDPVQFNNELWIRIDGARLGALLSGVVGFIVGYWSNK